MGLQLLPTGAEEDTKSSGNLALTAREAGLSTTISSFTPSSSSSSAPSQLGWLKGTVDLVVAAGVEDDMWMWTGVAEMWLEVSTAAVGESSSMTGMFSACEVEGTETSSCPLSGPNTTVLSFPSPSGPPGTTTALPLSITMSLANSSGTTWQNGPAWTSFSVLSPPDLCRSVSRESKALELAACLSLGAATSSEDSLSDIGVDTISGLPEDKLSKCCQRNVPVSSAG